MARNWSKDEVEATIQTYFAMLRRELRGEDYVKAEYRRDLQPRLDDRSEGAIEYKFQNVSAVLAELGYDYIPGYKPAHNYQQLLHETVAERLEAADDLHELLDRIVEGFRPEETPGIENRSFDDLNVDPPSSGTQRVESSPPVVSKISFAEKERRQRKVGKAGEEFVVNVEKNRLESAGRPDLAKNVEWAAETKGDGLGYDVLSFNTDGTRRYVEVKTTTGGKSVQFYVSKNELRTSQELKGQYFLYRVFGFNDAPSLYVLRGPLNKSCDLVPESYTAVPSG
jgi:hypothetical protein